MMAVTEVVLMVEAMVVVVTMTTTMLVALVVVVVGGDGGDRDNRGSGGCDSNVGDGDEVTGSIGGGGSRQYID